VLLTLKTVILYDIVYHKNCVSVSVQRYTQIVADKTIQNKVKNVENVRQRFIETQFTQQKQ
jgi:hypothetical protein